MTKRNGMLLAGAVGMLGLIGLRSTLGDETMMRMTAIEKVFVNSPGHTAEVADRAESLLDRIEVQRGSRYLDVGCGVGAAARNIAAKRGLTVVGVDIDPEQIEAARASTTLPNLDFQVMNATALQFGDGEFDVVASSKTTHHIPNYEDALAEMARVLKPGGYLIYTDLTGPDWLAAVGKRMLPIAGFPSETALDATAAKAGLSPVFRSRSFVLLDMIWRKVPPSQGGPQGSMTLNEKPRRP